MVEREPEELRVDSSNLSLSIKFTGFPDKVEVCRRLVPDTAIPVIRGYSE